MSHKCHTKISNEKKHQEFERFYVRQTSDIRGESDIKDFVGFAYYQPQDDIKIPYALFSLRPDIGRRLKTCRFDLAVKKKSREKLCPIRTRAAKKVIKEGVCNEYLHSWDQRKRYKVT